MGMYIERSIEMSHNSEYRLMPHKLRFIGRDGSMGLHKGGIYEACVYSGARYY